MRSRSILALLILCSTIAHAQRSRIDDDHENFFRIGAKAGVNINRVNGHSYKSGFAYNFQGGGFMQFNFSRTFGIQPEVNFVQTSSEFSQDPNEIYDDIFRDGSQKKAKLNYLEVPLLLNMAEVKAGDTSDNLTLMVMQWEDNSAVV